MFNQAKLSLLLVIVRKLAKTINPLPESTKLKVDAINSAGKHQLLNNKLQLESHIKTKNHAEIALNSISDGVICTDTNGIVNYLNLAAEKLTGWSRLEANGRPSSEIFKLIDGITHLPACSPVNYVLQNNKSSELAPNTLLIKHDGSEIAIEDSTSPIHDEQGRFTGVVIVFHDVSKTQAMTQKMTHLAQHDFLTSLPNRLLLNDRIAQAIATAERNGTQVALLFLDLDNFKFINDSLGHATGDKLLQSVAKRLTDSVRNSDTVSRQGGDEFVILLADSQNESDAALAAEKIINALIMPHTIGISQVHVTTSIGISIYPQDALEAELLLKSADTAMYHAKAKGRNNYQFFKSEMNTLAMQRMVVESHLRNAIEKQQLVLHYQPKVNLDTNQITGVEALVRWQHHEWGEMLPEKFIPIAEESGLIVPIGRWILREACRQAKYWLDIGLPAMTIAVNISAKEFLHKDFVEGVRAVLIETRLPAQYLELEITESVLMHDAKCSRENLNLLKKMDIKLAIDDFGTGYSSLSYLQRFPIDVLKIDQSFVHNITSASDEGIIVSAIINMGSSLKLKVIAEGIENPMQLEFLKIHRCEEGQGYIFSRALTAKDLQILVSNSMSTSNELAM